MYVIAFRYGVGSDTVAEFERTYRGDGVWARFFATGEGYLGTELLRAQGGDYLLLDRWDTAAAYEAFLAANREEYDRRNREAAALWEREERLGAYDLVAPV
jgi:heme-degrading monooxygenase HmoA